MKLLIGDVHFGKYTNNLTWLNAQLDFFRKQIFKVLQERKDITEVIFLGDVFDIRYSINTYTGIEVKNVIRELISINKDKTFYFVAGNHDFYSPLKEFEDYNAYNLVFGEEFENSYDNIHFITKGYLIKENGEAYLPWYSFNEEELLKPILEEHKEIKVIYTHTDLENIPYDIKPLLKDKIIFSGHIHYPFDDKYNKWYNLGACCALDFSDSNSSRYIYIIDDNYKIVDKIENTTTPKFKRFYNEDIFTLSKNDLENSIVEVYIYKDNQNKAQYIERIKEIKTNYIDYKIKFKPLENEITEELDLMDLNTDIHSFIQKNIPEHLNDKYENIKEKLNNKE